MKRIQAWCEAKRSDLVSSLNDNRGWSGKMFKFKLKLSNFYLRYQNGDIAEQFSAIYKIDSMKVLKLIKSFSLSCVAAY